MYLDVAERIIFSPVSGKKWWHFTRHDKVPLLHYEQVYITNVCTLHTSGDLFMVSVRTKRRHN